jgi:tRNA threonylcarbamoyladenosine biosynthesis protein TsaE
VTEANESRAKELRFLAYNEQDTKRLGAVLARILPAGTTVALLGTLGAGKTRLVQAIAAACGIPADRVTSPTFVLCQPYEGSRTLYHLDAYRLKDEDEFLELGPEEYFDSDGLTLVEWADRVESCLPPDYVEIRITVEDEQSRQFAIRAIGDEYQSTIAQLSETLNEHA